MDLTEKESAIEEMGDPTILDREELAFDGIDELRDRANDADELESDLEEAQETVEELREYEEMVSGVAEDDLEELTSLDDPVVVSSDRHEELTEIETELSDLFAEELSQHSPFEAEELSDRFGPMEMYESIGKTEGSLFDELGNAEDHVRSGSERDDEVEELAEADESEDAMDGKMESYVEELRDLGFNTQADKIESGELVIEQFAE